MECSTLFASDLFCVLFSIVSFIGNHVSGFCPIRFDSHSRYIKHLSTITKMYVGLPSSAPIHYFLLKALQPLNPSLCVPLLCSKFKHHEPFVLDKVIAPKVG